MSKLVTLDEIEEYENEVRRAHAENRAPALRDPREVFVDNLGNADSHLEELSASELSSETSKLHKERRDALKDDERQKAVIRDSTQRLPDGEGSTVPTQAPDEKRFAGPKNQDEKDAIERKVDHDFDYQRSFDDSFSDSNIPHLDDNGQVLGDSVNRVFTRKMSTTEPEQIVRENERNSVPVPERYRLENPPQVIQQSNPVTGEPPTPEQSGYVEGYVQSDENIAEGQEYFLEAPTAKDVPQTAITTPRPEHVIGDETGTTREPTRVNEGDVNSPGDAPDVPLTVPLSYGQVLQGAVKRPDHFDPPEKGVNEGQLSQADAAGIAANLPVDTMGLRGDNDARKAVIDALEVQPPGNVDPVYLTDEQLELNKRIQNPPEQSVFDESTSTENNEK